MGNLLVFKPWKNTKFLIPGIRKITNGKNAATAMITTVMGWSERVAWRQTKVGNGSVPKEQRKRKGSKSARSSSVQWVLLLGHHIGLTRKADLLSVRKQKKFLVVIRIVYESFSLEPPVLFVAVNFSSSFMEQPQGSCQGSSRQTTLCSDCWGER